MSVYNFQQGMMAGAAGAAGGYTIDQSIRFDGVRNSDMTRTLPGDGNLKTGTFSVWLKRSGLGSLQEIFTTWSIRSSFFFQSNDTVSMQIYNGSGYTTLTTPAVFRDPSAFGHYLFRWDTTQALAADRLQFYYNGVLQTVTGTYPAQNSTTTFSDATYTHVISGDGPANTLYEIDGYLAEIHYIDGTALDATSFGKVDSATGQWVPIEYTGGSYGTNGFYITGEDSADLGADYSGNSNDFTSSGLTSADQVTDTPTENYATWNPLDKSGSPTFSNGNLEFNEVAAGNAVRSTISASSGKWYFEATYTHSGASDGSATIGIQKTDEAINGATSIASTGVNTYVYRDDGRIINNGTGTSGFTNFGTGAVIMVAIDCDNNKLWFGVNGTWQASGNPSAGTGEQFSGVTSDSISAYAGFQSGTGTQTWSVNFGQTGGFSYTPPTDFIALSTSNLPDPTIADPSAYFQTTLYTGNGTAIGSGGNAISQSGNSTFQPDWVWIKGRSASTEHVLTDAVRGVTKEFSSNDFNAEETVAEGLTTFGSAGFTVGSDGSYNTSSATYVGWQWKANGAGSSNTDGSVSSTVSADTTAGFSIAKAAAPGNGVTFSIGHGLGVTPSMVICKGVGESLWSVYHHKISSPNDNYVRLDSTSAVILDSGIWGTGPTSSVFSAKSGTAMTHSEDFVIYCFAEVEGFSKFGSYTGNGSADGPMVNCGFLPAFVMVKALSTANGWNIVDTKRDTYNPVSAQLAANGADAEASGVAMDFLSSGFKIRDTSAGFNTNTNSYIYMAFAESPFKTANAR